MKPKSGQLELAKLIGIKATENDTYRTLVAKITDALSEEINEKPEEDPTEKQISYAKSLKISVGRGSKRLVSAKIADELEIRNKKALKKFGLSSGDMVIVDTLFGKKEYTISSIKDDGKIYFKGIGCPQAWAVHVLKVIKAKDP